MVSVAVLLAVMTSVCGACTTDVDGCSIPFGWTFFYKSLFTSACNQHDICYGCVSTQHSSLPFPSVRFKGVSMRSGKAHMRSTLSLRSFLPNNG